ncbi:hypothetical protein GX408_11705 [bacterium]|nr:hypothetical protein [bacterium]
METITGGITSVEYWICNAAFIQFGAWNALAFGIAGMTGAGIVAGVVIGVTAAAVCR